MTTASRKSDGRTWLVMGVLGALAVLGAWFLSQQERPPVIERSAIGFDGLGHWLTAGGVDARTFQGRGPLSGEGVGLRILPLYDNALDRFATGLRTGEAAYLNPAVRPISHHVVTMKAETLPTLIILPKWRDGVRLLGASHPEFLIGPTVDRESVIVASDEGNADAEPATEPDNRADDTADEADEPRPVYLEPEILQPSETGWVDVPLDGVLSGTARLLTPQWMRLPEGCEARIGEAERALLAQCTFDTLSYWVLSDPDLLNNHGLARGRNAARARELIAQLVDGAEGGDDVLIDYSTAVFLTARPDEHQRSWADMARMFEPPFSWLWIAGAALLSLILWRAGIRGRPLYSIFEQGHGAARRVALQAQARLMRNSHADGALIRTLVASRRQALAEAWLGRERRAGHAFQRVLSRLRLKDEALAAQLDEIFNRADALPDRVRSEVAVDALADVEHVYQQALELA